MRLIDADALKAKIRKAEKEFRRCKIEPFERKMAFADGVGAVADLIVDEVPTVEERKHGHWIETNECCTGAYESLDYYKCSVCGVVVLEDVDFGVGNYCPHCGAKMDGENNG